MNAGTSTSTSDGPVQRVSDIFDDALGVVYGYLARRCGSTDLAQELTATTFTRATAAAARGTVDEVTVAWLITIARNLLVDHWRREAVAKRALELAEERELLADPWIEVIDAERCRALLAELRPEHRTALSLRYLDDLPVSEVASLMDRSVRATESLLVRARGALRRRYEDTGGDDD